MDTAITWRVDCNALFAREKMVWAEMRHYTEGPIGQQHQFPVCPVGLPSPQLYYPLECVCPRYRKNVKSQRRSFFTHTCLTSILLLRTLLSDLGFHRADSVFFELSVLENQYSSALKDFLYFYSRGAIIRCITSQIL